MNEREIFAEALERKESAERAAFLNKACGDDLAMRNNIEELLSEHERLGNFIEAPASELAQVTLPLERTVNSSTITTVSLEAGVLGEYRILREIGRGGMGVVYEAEQVSLGRTVALKVLPYASMLDKTQLARFKNEARAAASLDHPNVVHVHSVGTERGVHYYAMQFIDGQTVEDLIAAEQSQRGAPHKTEADLPPGSSGYELTEAFAVPDVESSNRPEAPKETAKAPGPTTKTRIQGDERGRNRSVVELAIQAAKALEHAHRMGVVHRDIKPSNLLVDAEHHLWVADFGLALVEAEGNLTTSGSMLGTLRYMSPEQMRSDRRVLDHRTDIYSLGTTLYEMLTLQPAFPDGDVTMLTQRVAHEEPIAPRKLNSAIARDLETIVLKAMAKDPEDRYPTACDMAADLQRFLDDEPIHAKPPSSFERAKKWARRHRSVVSAVVATLAVAVMIAGGLLGRERSRTLAALEREKEQHGIALKQEAEASRQARQADQAQRLAEDKSVQLKEQRDLARENESFAKQLVYASDVRLAAQAWEDGDVRHYADLLDRYSQSISNDDLRGFEWRYLRQVGAAHFHAIAEGAEGVCSVRYSPDGNFLAAGRYDGTILIWDGHNGRQLATLSGHVRLVRGIDFSPDSKRLVSIGYGSVIRIWDLDGFREIRSIKAFENVHGYRVCFAMDGQAVIAIAEKSPAKLWDVDSGELIDSFGSNGRGCWGLAVSPDGQSCVVRENSSAFRIWDLSPRKHVAWMHFPTVNESAYCLRYSPDGAFIAAGTDERHVRLYEAGTGKLIVSFAGHDDKIWDVAFHPSGTMLASCDDGGVIRTWHLDNRAETSDTSEMEDWPPSFTGPATRAWSVDFSPDGERLAAASRDGTVRAWTGRAQPRQELNVADSIMSVFSPSGDELFIATSHAITRWNRLTNEVRPFDDSFQEKSRSLAVSPDGANIATGHEDGSIRLWNRKTERIAKLWRGHEDSVDQIVFSPTGTLLVTASWDGTARLWDIVAGEQKAVFSMPPHCCSAAFSPDGRTLAFSSEDNAMLYDALSGKRLHLLEGHQSTAQCVAFSPGGRWLATGSSDRTVRIWDVQSGKTRHVIAAHRDEICSLAFSPDGHTVASGDERGTIAFSHVETGRFLFETQVTNEEVGSLSFSPDGETLAATCYDRHVVLLHAPRLPSDVTDIDSDAPPSSICSVDLRTSQVKRLTSGTTHFRDACYSPDGKLIVMTGVPAEELE